MAACSYIWLWSIAMVVKRNGRRRMSGPSGYPHVAGRAKPTAETTSNLPFKPVQRWQMRVVLLDNHLLARS